MIFSFNPKNILIVHSNIGCCDLTCKGDTNREYWGVKFNGVKSVPHHLYHFSLYIDISDIEKKYHRSTWENNKLFLFLIFILNILNYTVNILAMDVVHFLEYH